jgi:protein-S-isoprenylcysteine O-methyltransferase Ste14
LVSTGGAVVFAVGAVIAGWGLILFHRARTTTTPGKASNALVMRGPYRFTRNPMYVGLIVAYVGEMGLLVQIAPLIPLLLVIAYVNWIVIPVEENQLRGLFGKDYVQFCNGVPRWL